MSELAAQSERISEERRNAERESANQSAALRQMDAEVARLERRLDDWMVQSERNKDLRGVRQALIEEKREEVARLEADHAAAETKVNELQQSMEELRRQREQAQQQAASVSAAAGGVGRAQPWRRSGLHPHRSHVRRPGAAGQPTGAAAGLRHRGRTTAHPRERTAGGGARAPGGRRAEAPSKKRRKSTEEARLLREQLKELEHNLKALRAEMDSFREARSTRSAHSAKLAVELEYMEAACVSDLGIEASELRQQEDVPRLEGEALAEEDEACRGLKQKLEAMGPVNMMALEEYQETADRHGFLETQRKDLMDAIENTQSTIREIDQITRQKFDEAFARINQNFSKTFTSLFGGGQGFMRLTDEENTAESGIDIVASPPGKKLQNVLLLSGGEKALTALALLVGIFEYAPSPVLRAGRSRCSAR